MEGILYEILDDIFNEMDADNDNIKQETRKSEYKDLIDGNIKTSYVVSYDEICNRFIREVDGASLSARTFECADFGKVTHDRLISRCREVFGGLHDNIGRANDKKKALAFDMAAVKEIGENFEIISEIKILEKDESLEDTEEDKGLWSMFESPQISLPMGTNPNPEGSKNESFATNDQEQNPIVSLAMGTSGLISANRAENDNKLKSMDEANIQNSQDNYTHNGNIIINDESDDKISTSTSDEIEIDIEHRKSKLVLKSPTSTQSWPGGTPEQVGEKS
jgi:hypothetical protein